MPLLCLAENFQLNLRERYRNESWAHLRRPIVDGWRSGGAGNWGRKLFAPSLPRHFLGSWQLGVDPLGGKRSAHVKECACIAGECRRFL